MPLLIRHYLDSVCRQHSVPATSIGPDALDALMAYRWPGNIRELKNEVERIVLKAGGRTVTHSDLPSELVRSAAITPASQQAKGSTTLARSEELASRMLQHG